MALKDKNKTDKETQAERLSDSSWATQLVPSTARAGMHSLALEAMFAITTRLCRSSPL